MSGKRKKPRSLRLRRKAKQRGGAHRALAATLAVLGLVLLSAAGFANAPAQADKSDEPSKAAVCKYVGTPGTDERLQAGGNPIVVDRKDWMQVGSYFQDAHGRSYVLSFLNPGDPEPSVNSCPTPEEPPVDVCDNLPGNQPEGTDCTPPPTDACPNLEGNQPPGTDCNPPTDACPDLPGQQEPGTDCTPPPTDVCPDLPGNQPEGTDCTPPPVDECSSLTGSIKTTLADGSVLNGNIYDAKTNVYAYGDQLGDATKAYVRVTDPSGSTVLSAVKEVAVANGSFGPIQLPTFSNTPNNGDEYKVWVSTSPDFEQGCTKFDNFKVRGEVSPEPTPVAPAAPLQLDVCEPTSGPTSDEYTIPVDPNFTYTVNGVTTASGTYPGSLDTYVVRAVAKQDVVVKQGAVTEWTLEFSRAQCLTPPPPVIAPDGSISVDCRGKGMAVADNSASTRSVGFEVVVNGHATLYSLHAGKARNIPFSGAKPGSKVVLQDGEANALASARVPNKCGGAVIGNSNISNTPTSAHTGLWTEPAPQSSDLARLLMGVSAALVLLSGLFFYGARRRGQAS